MTDGTAKPKKARTSITIQPDVWQRALLYCGTQTSVDGKKLPFSELVHKALVAYLDSVGG